MAALDRALTAPDGPPQSDGPTVVIATIGGTGGIGKTWLALTWAYRNLHHFPDGQLAVDLHGFSPDDPRTAADVLAEFLAALGVDRDRQPTDLDARAALYRTHTAGKRMLILLDNAATPDQVTPLLPGGNSCTVLVTSRHKLFALLARHRARPVHVDVLTDTESRTLLTAALDDARTAPVTAAVDRAVSELIALCKGFPLALSLIAAHIRTRPDQIEGIVTDLRDLGLTALDSEDADASLPTVLSWSMRRLSDQHRTMFGLLGIAPGPDIDLPAATHLIGLSEHDTRTLLHGLLDASLITRTPDGRYVMHDLIRDYAVTTARGNLAEPVRQAALERVVDFYGHIAYTAEHLLAPHRVRVWLDPPDVSTRLQPLADIPAALTWLDTHRSRLLATQRTAAIQGRHQAVWDLAWTLSTFLARRGHHTDQLAMWQAALEAAAHLPDPTDNSAVTMPGWTRASRPSNTCTRHSSWPNSTPTLLSRPTPTTPSRGPGHDGGMTGRPWNTPSAPWTCSAASTGRCGKPGCSARQGGPPPASVTTTPLAHTARPHSHYTMSTTTTVRRTPWTPGLHRPPHRPARRALDYYRQAVVLHRERGDTNNEADVLDHLGQTYAALSDHEQARVGLLQALQMYQTQQRTADIERVRQRLEELDIRTATHRDRTQLHE